MLVDVIQNLQDFDRLRSDWDYVYAQDPHATVFVSWPWLRGWIECERREWMVLSLRPTVESAYVGFMALAKNQRRPWNLTWLDDLHMGGNNLSDHAGFVCLPKFSDSVIATLAAFIRDKLHWATCYLRDVFDSRLDMFLQHFPKNEYAIQRLKSTQTPCLQLPDTWETYLNGFLTSRRRLDLQRCIRKTHNTTKFRITEVNDSNVRAQIETVLQLHAMRFGNQDGPSFERFRKLFLNCFYAQHLSLTVIWDGETPMAGLAAFIDRKKRSFAYYLGGFNDKYVSLAPGSVLQAYTIRYAIENGYREYDFLRGKEPYKYAFGAKDRFNTNVTIRRKGFTGLLAHCDEICKTGVRRVSSLRRLANRV